MRADIRTLSLVFALAVFSACGGINPEGQLEEAESLMAAGQYDEAAADALMGLEQDPSDAAIRWRLEFTVLEAQARAGHSASAIDTIERLAALESTQIKPSHYVSSADQLKGGGDGAGAIALLDKGLKRFPDNADLVKELERSKSTGGADELEALKSLGSLGE